LDIEECGICHVPDELELQKIHQPRLTMPVYPAFAGGFQTNLGRYLRASDCQEISVMAAGTTIPAAPARRAQAAVVLTEPRLRECRDCGLFQVVPSMEPETRALCLRCGATLRQTRADSLTRSLALNMASLVLLLMSATTTMMHVSIAGILRSADLFTGPVNLQQNGIWQLAVVVLFTTVAAPMLKLLAMVYVLTGIRLRRPPLHLRRVFAWVDRLRPWAMIEVYLLGVAVAYVKLLDIVSIDIGFALYTLVLLMLTTGWADSSLDHQAVWEAMERRGLTGSEVDHVALSSTRPGKGAIGCDVCGMVSQSRHEGHARCPRCEARLEVRKPNSIHRTWALMIASLILYIPANLYPVLTVISFGSGAPSTILGGVEELISGGMLPLAALVFFASILVPVLKLVGLTILLVSTQMRATGRLRDRTRLYRIVNTVGRWSMIDIFMESILVALVQFGALATIDPGIGAIAFAGVVVITMFAAEGFDPRLMWDAAGRRGEEAI
jgi:paraquat-inducible protein A